ncbi:MAG TPA: cytochrome c [Steroidobacteraceae bacterium]|nr:cytochrome c [Steroidobacteraceae bacterium]
MNKNQRTLWCSAALLVAAMTADVVLADDNPFALSLSGGGGGRNARLMTTDGRQIYEHVCQSCHMADGKGAKLGPAAYPALATNPKLVAKMYPAMMVVNGLGAMPAFGSMLSDEQVAIVVNYVRGNFGNRYADAVLPAEVATVRPAVQRVATELRGR